MGATPYATNGPDNTVGSTRSIANFPTTEGAYNVTEQLTKRQLLPNGAYIQRFELLKSTLPIEYSAKNGSLNGYWITYQTNSVFEYETSVISSVYSCATGHPIGKSSPFIFVSSTDSSTIESSDANSIYQISVHSKDSHGPI